MGLNLSHGGHLTHGVTLIFQENCIILFHIVDRDTGRVDFDEILKIAKKNKPKMIICGGSVTPDLLNSKNSRKLQMKWCFFNG